MAAMGPAEILLFLVLGMGNQAPDLVSLISPEDYFRSRGIEVSVAKMIDLAGKDPVDGKTQTAQLLALRFLGADPASLKKDKDLARAIEVLGRISEGKSAQDRLGFAKEYATRSLARLQGRQPALPVLPENSTRDEAMRWFPADTSLVGSMDLRGLQFPQPPGKALKVSPPWFLQGLLGAKNDLFFRIADAVGNVRIDRLAFAYADVPGNTNQSRFFYRLTGKVDHKRFVKYLQTEFGLKVQNRAGPKGETISVLELEQQPAGGMPQFAFVGDTDMVLAGYPMQNQGNHKEVLEQALDLAAGKGLAVTNGLLKGDLQKASAKAAILLVGELPGDVRKTFGPGALNLETLPQRLTCEVAAGADRLHFRFAGIFDNAADAKKFTTGVLKLKDDGVKAVKNLPEQFAPKEKKDALVKVLDAMTVEATGLNARGGVIVPLDTLRQWAELVVPAIPPPGPPLPKNGQ